MSKRLIKSQVLYELHILFDFQTGIPMYPNPQLEIRLFMKALLYKAFLLFSDF